MKKTIPLGKSVNKTLQNKIIEVLEKYAGANNPRDFNFTLTTLVTKPAFLKYLEKNYYKLFGNSETKYCNKFYFPLCMYAYYNQECKHNKAMFNLREEFLKNAENKIPSEETIMKWFYKRHQNEFIGLL